MRTPEQFWAMVDKKDDHWFWKGAKSKNKYGSLNWNGKTDYTHRVAWRLAHGEIPDGKVVRIACGVLHCVKDDHLELKTTAEVVKYVVSVRKRHGFGPLVDRTPKTPSPVQPVEGETKIKLSWEQ